MSLPLIVGGASMLMSFIQSQQAVNAAEEGSEASLAFARGIYEDYKRDWGPLEEMQRYDVQQPLEKTSFYRKTMAEIERGYGTQDATMRRRYGGQYTGLEAARRDSAYYDKVGRRAGVRAGAEVNRQNRIDTMLKNAKVLPGAVRNYQGALNQDSATKWNRANTAETDTGQSAQNMAMLYMLYGGGKPPPTTAGVNTPVTGVASAGDVWKPDPTYAKITET